MSYSSPEPKSAAHPGEVSRVERNDPLLSRAVFARTIAGLGILVCLFFGLLNSFSPRYHFHAWLECIAALILLQIFLKLCQEQAIAATFYAMTALYACLSILVIATGRPQDAIVTWGVIYPVLPLFLFGQWPGLPIAVAFDVLVIGFLGVDAATDLGPGFSWYAMIEMAGALSVSTGLAYFFEYNRATLVARQEQAAETDALTGILNRRGFLRGYARCAAQLHRNPGNLALLLIDLDHFKSINDEFGHGFGDVALCHVVHHVGRHVRSSDWFARFGGDEFVLLLTDTNGDEAEHFARRIQEIVRSHPLWHGERELTLTLSIGIAGTQVPDESFARLYAMADRRLYAAKQRGRNCVVNECAAEPCDMTDLATVPTS